MLKRNQDEHDNQPPDDAASAAVQKVTDEAEEKGYRGMKVDPLPNEAYSLESGPDSPPNVAGPNEGVKQHTLINDPGTKPTIKET